MYSLKELGVPHELICWRVMAHFERVVDRILISEVISSINSSRRSGNQGYPFSPCRFGFEQYIENSSWQEVGLSCYYMPTIF